MGNELAIRRAGETAIEIRQVTFLDFSLNERLRICEVLATATTLPTNFKGNLGNVWIAAERGARLGLSPTESISAVMVVNGVASIWGDTMKAKVMASGLLEEFEEWFEIDNERPRGDRFDPVKLTEAGRAVVAWCRVKRKGKAEVLKSYGVDDARTAGLWMAKDSWRKSPKRMLAARPRSFALRDEFPDVLGGFISREEAEDLSVEATAAGAIAEASQPETKGTAIAETLTRGGAVMTQERRDEIEMVESMLESAGRTKVIGEIRTALALPKAVEAMSQEQGVLYVNALNLAVDQWTAEKDSAGDQGGTNK